jgi:hypothetical protein
MFRFKDFLEMMEKANMWNHNINYDEKPLMYEFTEDCSGMYTCEPYKTELLKNWKFTSLDAATTSSKNLLEMFENYVARGDFVGADLTRKYLQAGSIRSIIQKECKDKFLESYSKAIQNSGYLKLKSIFLDEKNLLAKEDSR